MITAKTPSTLYLAPEDFQRLKLLADAMPKSTAEDERPTLRGEIERATIVARGALPPGVVTVNSRVRLQDLSSDEVEEYILTWPERADVAAHRLSVTAPIGTAILGYRKGDEIAWPTPGGTRLLKIVNVEPVSEESLKDAGEVVLSRLLSGVPLPPAEGT